MILLNPIWLYALAALSIPVAIHLWNVRPGKTLKVGSIALVNESAQKSTRSLKLHDILLLLVRCLLLALVALVLTMPLWQKRIDSSTIKGWVLLPKANLKESYQKFKPAVDSLTKAGYELHYFDRGFAKAKLNEALADTISLKSSLNISYWSLIQQLDGQVPSMMPIYLFTSKGSSHFSGEKPQVGLNLHWQTYVPADSTDTWVEKAYFSNNNDIRVVQGNSSPSGTRFADYTIQAGNLKNSPFVINTDSGRVRIGTKKGIAVVADTSTWRFAIYSEKNSIYANYLKAALASVIQFTKHKAVINLYTDLNNKTVRQNWIFWLSEKPVGTQITQNCDNLFAYQPGKVKELDSWITNEDQFLSKQKIAVYKLVVPAKENGFAIWADGFGDPVLSSERQGQTNLYHFYSRFDPAWSDLVWSNDFPKMMLKLIVNQANPDVKHDRRGIDNRQLLPSMTSGVRGADKLTEHTDLTHYFWLLLIFVFAAERWLAHQKSEKKVLRNG